MVNINSIPEPFRGFLGAGQADDMQKEVRQKEQGISAASLDFDKAGAENSRTDMQDLLFLAAILMLCDE